MTCVILETAVRYSYAYAINQPARRGPYPPSRLVLSRVTSTDVPQQKARLPHGGGLSFFNTAGRRSVSQEPDHYFTNHFGHFLAWSLHSPARPEFGKWSWLEIVGQGTSREYRFVMPASPETKTRVRNGYLYWGMLIEGEASWALVMGRLSRFQRGNDGAVSPVPHGHMPLSPIRSVGV